MVNWVYGLFLDVSFLLAGMSAVNGYFVFKYRKEFSAQQLQKLVISLFIMVSGANALQWSVPPDIKFQIFLPGLIMNFVLTFIAYYFWCRKTVRKHREQLFEKIQIVPPALLVMFIIIACFYKHPFVFMPYSHKSSVFGRCFLF
ncbi:MAG: hypothetical protein IJ479_02230 [Alphaproteobacteria bacterium]|nr:hypothetical protein [Alphaproteobacteria bacterium]